ncbi:hypothetical protein GDO86_014358 [Hymenochirus boettgeri]|uniref:Dendritic cell-specific transmembrane protein-like domain-containing protein n=1 Tax=Hymenochirus boettgeri TaxID=247094 RepID=A0A8T2JNT5_9PIPI|nr:hypothetical protein GDO86_014358 [Hymenochirus boettgeri]
MEATAKLAASCCNMMAELLVKFLKFLFELFKFILKSLWKGIVGACGFCCSMCPCQTGWDWLGCFCRCLDTKGADEVSALDHIDESLEKKKKVEPKLIEDSPSKSMFRNFLHFSIGLFLTSLYAAMALYVFGYNLFFCIVTSPILGFFLSLGMAYSCSVRINIMLILPQIFSVQGRNFMVVAIFGLTMSGPFGNILENYRRTTETLYCGIELAKNTTESLIMAVKRPLLRAVDSIKKMSKGLGDLSKKASKFFESLTYEVKNLGSSLRRLWHNIYNIKEICEEYTGSPHVKCNNFFLKGKEKCMNTVKVKFLCNIMEIRKAVCLPLHLPCAVPAVIQKFARIHKTKPVQLLIQAVKKQFNIKVTVNKHFDITFNSSNSMFKAAKDIINEVDEKLSPYIEAFQMLTYSLLVMIIYFYIIAMRYHQKYLFEDDFDNVYITRNFEQLDVMCLRRGDRTLLPLDLKESERYIRPTSVKLTKRELKGYAFAISMVLRCLIVCSIIICMDYSFYWFLAMMSYIQGASLKVIAPQIASISVKGDGILSDMFRSLVSAFNNLLPENVNSVSKNCIIVPSEPNYRMYILIGVLHALAMFISIIGVFVRRLRRSVCAYYYPVREQQRICHLRQKLITRRTGWGDCIMNCILKTSSDKGHTDFFHMLAAKIPFLSNFTSRLAKSQQYCIACSKICHEKNSYEFRPCLTNGCQALYCGDCFDILDNACMICMMPIAFEETVQEEIDSSDDEMVLLWIEARKTLDENERVKKKKMKKCLKGCFKDAEKRGKKGDAHSQKRAQMLKKELDQEEDSSEATDESSDESE